MENRSARTVGPHHPTAIRLREIAAEMDRYAEELLEFITDFRPDDQQRLRDESTDLRAMARAFRILADGFLFTE
jgi:hypothetical protein